MLRHASFTTGKINPKLILLDFFCILHIQPPVAHVVYKCYLPAIAESARDIKVGWVLTVYSHWEFSTSPSMSPSHLKHQQIGAWIQRPTKRSVIFISLGARQTAPFLGQSNSTSQSPWRQSINLMIQHLIWSQLWKLSMLPLGSLIHLHYSKSSWTSKSPIPHTQHHPSTRWLCFSLGNVTDLGNLCRYYTHTHVRYGWGYSHGTPVPVPVPVPQVSKQRKSIYYWLEI